MGMTMTATRQRAGDWHGVQAMKAYKRRDYEAYLRHSKIADAIWSEVK